MHPRHPAALASIRVTLDSMRRPVTLVIVLAMILALGVVVPAPVSADPAAQPLDDTEPRSDGDGTSGQGVSDGDDESVEGDGDGQTEDGGEESIRFVDDDDPAPGDALTSPLDEPDPTSDGVESLGGPVDPASEGEPGCGLVVDDVHVVSTTVHLQTVGSGGEGHGECGLGASYHLAADIDLVSITNFVPIASGSAFTGTFDGNGHTISNLKIDRDASNQGLFAAIGVGGGVRSLTLTNVNVIGGWAVGGLAGVSSGTVTEVSASGRIENTSPSGTAADAGGLLGLNSAGGSVIDSEVYSIEVVGLHNNVGGLVGQNSGTIERSRASGTVSSSNGTGTADSYGAVGGLVGWNPGGIISNSESSATVDGSELHQHTGGLVGDNSGTIVSSSAEGPVAGLIRVGGLVGVNSGTVANSSASGTVTGTSTGIVGLVGTLSSGSVNNSYARGLVSSSEVPTVGGLIGWHEAGSIDNSFWDTETSEQTTSAGGEGRTTDQMTRLVTYNHEGEGWPIIAGWEPDGDNIWGMCRQENDGYPFLLWQFTDETSGCLTPSADNSSIAAEPPSVAADGTSTATIVVEVRDDSASPGNSIPHVDVGLAHTAEGISIDGVLGASATATTDADGRVSLPVSTETPGEVRFAATAVPRDFAQDIGNVEVVFLEVPSATTSTVSASAPTVSADGADHTLVSVTVRGFDDQPIAGAEVVLDQDEGQSRIDRQPVVSATSTTDAQGLASFSVSSVNAGEVTYAATAAGVVLDGTAVVTFEAVPEAELSTVSATQDTDRADGSASSTITVEVLDHAGEPISNLEVALSQPTPRSRGSMAARWCLPSRRPTSTESRASRSARCSSAR